jgi:hypothetical protein
MAPRPALKSWKTARKTAQPELRDYFSAQDGSPKTAPKTAQPELRDYFSGKPLRKPLSLNCAIISLLRMAPQTALDRLR